MKPLHSITYPCIDDIPKHKIFADWLMEQGDRRGEIIALSLKLMNKEVIKLSKELDNDKYPGMSYLERLDRGYGIIYRIELLFGKNQFEINHWSNVILRGI